jgi:1-acyl-sn-glycerol-3-phosphate acyltransferase
VSVKVRKVRQKRGWAIDLGVVILKPALFATTRRTWVDGEKIPAEGGCIVVVNHVSHADPLLTALFVYDHGRIPRYLAKSGLFRKKLLATYLTAAGQIPVERLSRTAIGAYDAAVAAVREGECVVVYPEGTLTRDPGLWPMSGKSGAARIALETGCPVIPVAHWGVQEILPPYSARPRIFPRRRVTMKAGDPVDLDDLIGKGRSTEAINQATARIMDSLTALVAELRGESAPAERFDPRRMGVQQIGNPNKDRKKNK